MSRAAIVLDATVLSVFLSFFPILTGTAHAKTKESPAPNGTAARIELPVQLYRGYLVVVEGSIDGLEHQNLLVDTGTDPSMVNARIIHALGLATRPATLAVANGAMQTDAALLPDLQVGPVHAESLPVLVQDFSTLEQELGVSIGAVIGMDVLGRTSFRLDYLAKRLVFGPIVPSGISLPLNASESFATVDLLVGGQNTHLLVDTGAAGLVFFESRMGKRLPLENHGAFRQDASLAGKFKTRMVSPGELLLGGHRFHLEKAFLAEDHQDTDKSFDGLLGVGAMGFKSISFDFGMRRLYLQI